MNRLSNEITSSEKLQFYDRYLNRVKSKDSELTIECANYGQLECLKYAYDNCCPWNEWICYFAAEYGHLDCLQYAHDNDCPWDEDTCFYAILRCSRLKCLRYACSHLKCLRYALINDCPYDKSNCIEYAYNRKVVEALFEELRPSWWNDMSPEGGGR